MKFSNAVIKVDWFAEQKLIDFISNSITSYLQRK
jgi:hypothetical protein